jgi:hypothetical protein
MIFPPGFFLSMQHLILHLPHEARLGGPVLACWCYPIERCLKLLRQKCKNKAKIEASVAEAFAIEEVSTFTQAYYTEKLASVHNPTSRYNVEENSSTLSLFKGDLGKGSAGVNKNLTHEEWTSIMMYLLLNLDECLDYQK